MQKETIYMICQSLYSWINMKNINMLHDELAQRQVKAKQNLQTESMLIFLTFHKKIRLHIHM